MTPPSPTTLPPFQAQQQQIDEAASNFPATHPVSLQRRPEEEEQGVSSSATSPSPPPPPAAARFSTPSSCSQLSERSGNVRKRKLVDAADSTAVDEPPVRGSPCPAAVVSAGEPSKASSSPTSPLSIDTDVDDYDTPYFTAAGSATESTISLTSTTLQVASLGGEPCDSASFDRSSSSSLFSPNASFYETTPPSPLPTLVNEHDSIMTTTTTPAPESAPTAAPLDPASYLGPSTNPTSKNPPSRSQSPAKRLKSEEPPKTTFETGPDGTPATPEPMDEDAKSREASVDMVDATSPPETAEPIDSSAESSVAATATEPSTASTSTATSIVASPPPSVPDQIEMLLVANAKSPREGEIYYVIASSWLKRFIAQSPDAAQDAHIDLKEIPDEPLTPIDNSSIVNTEQIAELERKKTEDGSVTDEVFDGFVPLKPHLLNGEHYEVLSGEMWNNLVSWYGLAKDSPVLRRRAVNTVEGGDGRTKQVIVEVYPPLFTVYRLRDPGSIVTKESLQSEKQLNPKKLVVATAEGFQKFLKKIKSLAGVDNSRKARLWKVNLIPDDTADKTSRKSPKPSTTGTFKQLVLDLQTFMALDPGSGRELINIPDYTNNPKYIGSMRVGMVGLSGGGAIVVEEQSSDGKWITEMTVKPASKFGESVTVAKHGFSKSATTVKKKFSAPSSPSRSASPAKSVLSKPINYLTAKPSRPLGTCGLSNLGNTCYMNSALQCLRSVEELSKYFLSHEYEKELNPSNPLSHQGKVAKAYAGLLKNIFTPASPSCFAPREFKSIIGRFGPAFSGYQQQDSQEFLAFLLDGMHEDLNRIMNKPYTEKPDSTDEMVGNAELIAELAEKHWNIYKSRNDSAVADLFAGLYQSTLVCPECRKVSITFDPFMDLTLPLPIESFWSAELCFFPRKSRTFKTPVRVPVEMPKTSSIASLKEYLRKKFDVDPKKLMISEVYKNKFYKHYEDYMAVNEISTSDNVVVYELDEVPTSWPAPRNRKMRSMLSCDDEPEDSSESDRILVPVFLKHQPKRRSFNVSDEFGMPFFITLTRDEASEYTAILEKIVDRLQFLTTRDVYADDEEDYDAPEEVSLSAVYTMETLEEDKDGFVDVSMMDAASASQSIEADSEPESIPAPASARRKVPNHTADAFVMKISKKKHGRLPTGMSGLDTDLDLMERFQPTPVRISSPAPQAQPSALFSSLNSTGNSGRRTPVSQVSDDDDLYQDAEEIERMEPQEDMMQDSSEDEGVSSNPNMSTFAPPVPVSTFYGISPANGSSSPPRSPYGSAEAGPLVRLGEAIILEFTDEGRPALFGGKSVEDFSGKGTWDDMPIIEDPELARRRRRREEKRNRGIHLEDCLDEFVKEEVLSAEDPWYCPRCKEHRRASKKFELWKCPDILVVHLKRFSSSRSLRDKIDAMIDCPIEGLDLSKRVGITEGKPMLYDLIAVDNHYGGLGGGHYTGSVKNWIDGKWYYCDDGSVREINPNLVVTPAAYLLFYRRRTTQPLGGLKFEQILTEADNAKLTADTTTPEEEESEAEEAPSSPASNFIGPVLPFSRKVYQEVGNNTLWGNSVPLKPDDPEVDAMMAARDEDDETLPSYEDAIAGGVSLGCGGADDEGLGDMADDLFVSVPQPKEGEEGEEKVDEIKV